jgi:hypothetical protein
MTSNSHYDPFCGLAGYLYHQPLATQDNKLFEKDATPPAGQTASFKKDAVALNLTRDENPAAALVWNLHYPRRLFRSLTAMGRLMGSISCH